MDNLVKLFANKLNGREYLEEIREDEKQYAKENGLVVVFGGSDNLMEFRGAIDDEIGCFGGATAYITENGVCYDECKTLCKKIKAVFNGVRGYSWHYETDIPHETFDIIDDGEAYCQGIVFNIECLKESGLSGNEKGLPD